MSFVLFCIFAGYLWIVLLAGPKFMKNREAFNITKVVQFYNICQVIVCSIYVIRSQMIGFTMNHLWKCERFEFLSEDIKLEVRIGFWFFLLVRLAEFWETIFFILRKKPNQASFLHIFHHIGSVLMTWLFIVMNAGKIFQSLCKLVKLVKFINMTRHNFIIPFSSLNSYLFDLHKI